ncbi:hypothetical protein [Phaeobacter sp. HF9A]|uniref:NYN domain-containing protein n=1 Tax=Phaeobacter sp. HF9A TaxID=2721561 RepID=UPI001431070B|nr:hypothetical protein [Phaeobacter sp. HF9A]NIZ15362.1 hypothetical protein [Phaeobacter sp. HF9A]
MVEAAFLILLVGLLLVLLRFRKRAQRPRLAIIDGSNVLYWKETQLSLEPVQDVIKALRVAGYRPCVVFDANAGYLVAGRYMSGERFAKALGLPKVQSHVVPKGQPADPHILRMARDSGGIIVSRDRFRDWEIEFPQVMRADRLVRGGYRRGEIWLDLPKEAAR